MVVGWLPTCIGMNLTLQKVLQDALQPHVGAVPPSETELDALSLRAEALLLKRFPGVKGLEALLKAVREVHLEPR